MTHPRSSLRSPPPQGGDASSPAKPVLRRLLGQTLSALAPVVLTACSAPPAETKHFPLDAGHRWVYDVKTEWENNIVEHETRVFTTHGSETVEGVDGGPAFRRRSDSGVEYWLRADASGIYRVAAKSDIDAEPKPDAPKRYVLKTPLAVGTVWQTHTTAYLLQRRQEFPREIRHTHPKVPMGYSIDAVNETVQTRAGKFEHCLRVKGISTLRLYADPVVGWKDMVLTTTEWYCPGVGLARVVREEPAQSTFLTGGTQTLELVQWQ
jgi:hypothetical protein